MSQLTSRLAGVVLEGAKAGLTSQDRKTRLTSTFTELTFWNYDRRPGSGEKMLLGVRPRPGSESKILLWV